MTGGDHPGRAGGADSSRVTIFERFARAFPMVSDEAERWKKEGPLFVRLAREAGSGAGRVLDLACGSGFHARHLAAEGLSVTAVDILPGAIEAGRSLAGGELVRWVAADITRPVEGQFDLALIVGNTLSLMGEEAVVGAAIASAAGALAAGGVLLVHVIDYDYLRAHPVRIVREGELDGRPVRFEKRIDARSGGATVTVTLTSGEGPGASAETQAERLTDWGPERLSELAAAEGLELAEELGGADGSPRLPGATKDVYLVLEKG